jgi:riboflavin biosynthesis pyrimidine reductase
MMMVADIRRDNMLFSFAARRDGSIGRGGKSRRNSYHNTNIAMLEQRRRQCDSATAMATTMVRTARTKTMLLMCKT